MVLKSLALFHLKNNFIWASFVLSLLEVKLSVREFGALILHAQFLGTALG